MDVNQKLDALGSTIEEFKKANDQRIASLEKRGHVDPLLEEKVTKANDAITKLHDELAQIKTALNRSNIDPENKGDGMQESREAKAAFQKFLRKGDERMSDAEIKLLATDNQGDGGYLARPELAQNISKLVFESSPIRQIASVVQIGSNALEIIEDNGEAEANWVGEHDPRPETATPVIGKRTVIAQEIYANPPATQRILDDAMFDIEAWLAGKVAEKFSRMEAAAFVSGDGVNKPKGFLTYPDGTGAGQIERIPSGSAGAVTSDSLITVQTALKETYQANATFLMARATAAHLRKLKDAQGRYIWESSMQLGAPQTVLGKPITFAVDMPAVGAGAAAIVYGDFKQGYQILDRIGIRVLRDPYTHKPYVTFYTTKRVGGDVGKFEAIKILTLSA